jgi:hypothetical protein
LKVQAQFGRLAWAKWGLTAGRINSSHFRLGVDKNYPPVRTAQPFFNGIGPKENLILSIVSEGYVFASFLARFVNIVKAKAKAKINLSFFCMPFLI